MNHPAEIKIHKYLSGLKSEDSVMSPEVIDQITSDVREALTKQFVDKRSNQFTLRMSNIGRSYCQLWFDKNKPEAASKPSASFIMTMMMGDIVEAVFKGILKQAGVEYKNGEKVTLKLDNGKSIDGTPDLITNDAVDDIKSASPWSYENKFKDYNTLAEHDSFGYVSQLAGYSVATKTKPGGWWVINKANGNFKYVAASNIDTDTCVKKTKALTEELEENRFRRCYQDVEETDRKKPSGNRKLGIECNFCNYKHACWPNLQERPSLVSKAEIPPMVCYTEIRSV